MTLTAANVTSRLTELVGAEHIVADPSLCSAYRLDEATPAAVLRPDSSAEIVEIMRFAAAERLAVIVTAGRSKLGIGMPPQRYDLALDLSRMNRVLAYDPRDLTLGVEPGVRAADLARLLAGQHQMLPLAPAFADRATIGGIIAAGADSPLRQGYGSARDYVLGMEFVTGAGVASKSGGRVVKNVTGYDIHKLLIGSLGTLAVITRVNFRTFPLPTAEQTFVAVSSTMEAALGLCSAITKSQLQPVLLELLDPGAGRLIAMHAGTHVTADHWTVVIGAAGPQAVVERYARELESMTGKSRCEALVTLGSGDQNAWLTCISEFPRLVLQAFPGSAIFRIAAPLSAAAELMQQLCSIAELHGLGCATIVRAAGVIYAALLPSSEDVGSSPDGTNQLASGLSAACRKVMHMASAASVKPMMEWCPLSVKRDMNIWPPPGDEQAIASRLKNVFDPHAILAPGRFQGGI